MRHEHGVSTRFRSASGVQSGKGSPGCIPGRKGKKGKKGGGQDKRTWHSIAPVQEILVVCTLVSGAAGGTTVLGIVCRDCSQSLGFARF